MSKFLFFFALLTVLVVSHLVVPHLAIAAGPLVECGNNTDPEDLVNGPCTLGDFFILIRDIYNFIVWQIATPLATLVIMFGGILMLLSGLNAKWYDTGKSMIKWAIIAILLIWGAVLIINTILGAIGATPPALP